MRAPSLTCVTGARIYRQSGCPSREASAMTACVWRSRVCRASTVFDHRVSARPAMALRRLMVKWTRSASSRYNASCSTDQCWNTLDHRWAPVCSSWVGGFQERPGVAAVEIKQDFNMSSVSVTVINRNLWILWNQNNDT